MLHGAQISSDAIKYADEHRSMPTLLAMLKYYQALQRYQKVTGISHHKLLALVKDMSKKN